MMRFTKNSAVLKKEIDYKTIILLMVMAISLLVAVVTVHRVIRNYVFQAVAQTTEESVEKIENSTKYALETIRSFCLLIYNDDHAIALRNSSEISMNEAVSHISELYRFETSGNFIDSIYIYNGKLNYIYTTNKSSAPVSEFFDAEAVDMILNRQIGQSLKPIIRKGADISSTSSVTQVYSFLVFGTDRDGRPSDNAVMVNVNPSWYNDLFFDGKGAYPSYFIDMNLDVIAAWDSSSDIRIPEGMQEQLKDAIDKGERSGYITDSVLTATSPVCFFAYAGINNWYYVRIGTYGGMFPYLLSIERVSNFLIFISLVVIAGLIVIYMLPYRKIRRSIENLGVETLGDDTGNMTDKLNKLIETSVDSKRIQESLGKLMREEVIRSYLYASPAVSISEDIVSEYQLNLRLDKPVTMILICDGIRIDEYLAIIQKVWQYTDGVVMAGNHSVILTQPEGDCDMLSVLTAISNHFGRKRCFVTSEPIDDWQLLCKTYERLRRQSLVFAVRPDIYWIDAMLSNAEPHKTDEELLPAIKGIIDSLKSSDIAETRKKYDDFISELCPLDYTSIISGVNNLRDQSIRVLNKLKPDNHYRKIRHETIDDWLCEMKSPHALQVFFYGLFEEIISCTRNEKKVRTMRNADKVLDIIHQEHQNSTLDAQAIADRLGVSYAYLSRSFKEATGQSIASYITQMRMEDARQLLLQQGIKVKAIPAMVGFENQQYFFVLFKKQYGETPGQYRSRMLGVKEDNIYPNDAVNLENGVE